MFFHHLTDVHVWNQIPSNKNKIVANQRLSFNFTKCISHWQAGFCRHQGCHWHWWGSIMPLWLPVFENRSCEITTGQISSKKRWVCMFTWCVSVIRWLSVTGMYMSLGGSVIWRACYRVGVTQWVCHWVSVCQMSAIGLCHLVSVHHWYVYVTGWVCYFVCMLQGGCLSLGGCVTG